MIETCTLKSSFGAIIVVPLLNSKRRGNRSVWEGGTAACSVLNAWLVAYLSTGYQACSFYTAIMLTELRVLEKRCRKPLT